jgi:hypothetical protein
LLSIVGSQNLAPLEIDGLGGYNGGGLTVKAPKADNDYVFATIVVIESDILEKSQIIQSGENLNHEGMVWHPSSVRCCVPKKGSSSDGKGSSPIPGASLPKSSATARHYP